MKKVIYVLILCLYILPITVKAGIICEDGWESSCVVSGPGCCSHHGGIADNDNYYSNSSSSDVEPVGAWFYILLFGGPCIWVLFSTLKEKFKENLNKTNPNDKNKKEKIYTCGACGNEVSKEDVKCSNCGAKFEDDN